MSDKKEVIFSIVDTLDQIIEELKWSDVFGNIGAHFV